MGRDRGQDRKLHESGDLAVKLDSGDENSLASSSVISELIRNGVNFFVLSPGFRSTPLTAAIARNASAESIIHFDERGGAYFALGHARATGCPAALVCTSGTAVVNYFPAVVEASQEMIPLILLTADRPAELRDCGANQTIDQVDIFGRHARYSVDLPCPDEKNDPKLWSRIVKESVQKATGSPAGPVHLNFQFREPLVPSVEAEEDKPKTESVTKSTDLELKLTGSDIDTWSSAINKSDSLVMIAGHLRSDAERKAVLSLAEGLGCPVLADIRSGIRGSTDGSWLVSHYDRILTAEADGIIDESSTVLQIGSRLVSSSLLKRITDIRPKQYIQVDSDPRGLDPTHTVTDRVVADVKEFCKSLAERIPSGTRHSRMDEISSRQRLVSDILAEFSETETDLSEPLVAMLLANSMKEDSIIYAANSMPIRLLERYAEPCSPLKVYANRGASGIDGTVASAAGFCMAVRQRVTLFCGDLALLHDLNSLRLIQQLQLPVTLVIINNDGGGIFDRLPIRQCNDIFREYFITPHGLTFEKAASMFGISYDRPTGAEALVDALSSANSSRQPRMIELCVDREVSFDAEQRILRTIVERSK